MDEPRPPRPATEPDATPPPPPARHGGELVVLNRDLFFGVRIGNLLRGLGYRVAFVADTAGFAARLRAPEPPVLGLVDLAAGVDWAAVGALTADPAVSTPILVFGPHKDVAGFRAAKAAGVARVVSNGDFHRGMTDLVARYARPPDR